jgi:SAM-dependent methyltransferase
MKAFALHSLGRLRLLRPTYRGYERLRAVGRSGAATTEELPVPPARLRIRVAGTAELDWFLEGGRLAEETLRTAVARAGTSLEDMASVLDFGCGCGRVTRYWSAFAGEISGSDVSAKAVEWCRANLRFGRFETNALEPPLAFDDESFDLVYALSVFTHLTADLQLAWRDELRRVLRPGGRLLLTTHGRSYLPRLETAERERFDRGELVVRWGDLPGTNLCSAYHPEPYLRGTLAQGFTFLELEPEGARGNPTQDLVLLRRQ